MIVALETSKPNPKIVNWVTLTVASIEFASGFAFFVAMMIGLFGDHLKERSKMEGKCSISPK